MAFENEGKRIDVGYKRPPVEHQFKPGNKPAPRRKRQVKAPNAAALLIKILSQEQRVEIAGKVRWMTKGRLLIMVAFELAEQGNPTLSRALAKLLFKGAHSTKVNERLLQLQRQDGTWATMTHSGEPVDLADLAWG